MITEIREPNFQIDLPGEWVPADSSDPSTFHFRDLHGDQTLSVTLLGVRPVFAIADRRRLLEDYLHHRTKFEKGQCPGLRQSVAVAHEHENPCVGEWYAEEPETGRRLLHRVVLLGSLLADFVYEAADADEAAFRLRADTSLGTATVSEE